MKNTILIFLFFFLLVSCKNNEIIQKNISQKEITIENENNDQIENWIISTNTSEGIDKMFTTIGDFKKATNTYTSLAFTNEKYTYTETEILSYLSTIIEKNQYSHKDFRIVFPENIQFSLKLANMLTKLQVKNLIINITKTTNGEQDISYNFSKILLESQNITNTVAISSTKEFVFFLEDKEGNLTKILSTKELIPKIFVNISSLGIKNNENENIKTLYWKYFE